MMRSILRWRDRDIASAAWHDSQILPGVRFQIRKVSLGKRIELAARLRELYLQNQWIGSGGATDDVDTAHADLLIRRLYLEWGVIAIKGLRLDGRSASPGSLIESAPEELADEAIELVKAQLGLTDEERKNF